VLAGLLKAALGEEVNLVNAPQEAATRGIIVEETTRRRPHGFPNTVEVAIVDGGREFALEGAVGQDGSPRTVSLDGISLEAPLQGTLLLSRNVDVPGVIGRIGTALGNIGVNIATFALGRRTPGGGGEALALVGLDGNVSPLVVQEIRSLPSVTDARVVLLPAAPQASAAPR
jgi:D-3-phosphoglycerate dehydrogenase / 2-oxoglutarate reductase